MKIINGEDITEIGTASTLRDYNQKMLLTASNKVFLIYGDLMQNFYLNAHDTKITMNLLGELILAMREDLGHKDWLITLYWFDSIRPWIKDINKYIPKKYQGIRGQYNKKVSPIAKGVLKGNPDSNTGS